MTEATQRLTMALSGAIILHAIVLSLQLKTAETLPAHLPVRGIRVSLEVEKTAKEKPAEKTTVRQKKNSTPPGSESHPETETAKPPPVPRKIVSNRKKRKTVPPLPVAKISATKPENRQIENNRKMIPSSPGQAPDTVQQASPLYRSNPPPEYPSIARRRGQEGVVLLEALVEITGKVSQLRLLNSSGYHALDNAALRAVRNWRFTPGTINGEQRQMRVKVPVRFRLK